MATSQTLPEPDPAAVSRVPLPRAFTCALLAITAASLSLRIYDLNAESLWMDEIVTVESFTLPLRQIVTQSAEIGQPPLENLIGAVLHRLGFTETDGQARLPAVLFGAGGVLLLGWWLGRVGGSAVGLAAAALLAVCPLHVAMSREARCYTICFFFILASILSFAYARRRNTLPAWCLFGGCLWCMLMTRWIDPHFITMGLAAFALWTFWQSRRLPDILDRNAETHKLWATVTAVSIAYAAYGPIFGIIFDRSRRGVAAHAEGSMDRMGHLIADGFTAMFSGVSTRTLLRPLDVSPWIPLCAAVLVGLGLCVAFVRARRTTSFDTRLFLFTALPFPFVYALVFATLANATPKPQYLLPMAALVFGAIALTADAVRHRTRGIGRAASWVGFVAVLVAVGAPMTGASLDRITTVAKRDWRSVITHLRQHSRRSDAFALIASDTVPPSFYPGVFGRARYGLGDTKFFRVNLRTELAELSNAPWTRTDNTVWIIAYTDRMYLGTDQLSAPSDTPLNVKVHEFNGLLLTEIQGQEPASHRLMDGFAMLVDNAKPGGALTAPAVLRGKWLLTHGRQADARNSFDAALHQCRNETERAILRSAYIPPTLVAETD